MSHEAIDAESPDRGEILRFYLAAVLPLVSQQFQVPHVRVAAQVFILGMADMLRQAEDVAWDQFIDIYESTLRYYSLLPESGAEAFVRDVGEAATQRQEIGQLMHQGAQSIMMYVSERDANAPNDLLGVPLYAQKYASAFTELACVNLVGASHTAPTPLISSVEFAPKRRPSLLDALLGRRNAKSPRTPPLVRLSGGDGSSEDDAVIVHTTNRADGVAAEYQQLQEIFGKRGTDWELEMQLLKEINGRDYDIFKLKLSNGTCKTYVFDISDYL